MTSKGNIYPGETASNSMKDEIVISGISGRFPESDNMAELRDNLMEKRDMITSDGRRWKLDHPHIPQRTGKINDIDKFDARFFGVHSKQAHSMDPVGRMLLEHAYEAVVDAGINPKRLRGSRTGVFVGACFTESEKTWFYEKMRVNGFGITGCSRAMLANRISYWLGVTGPSLTVDSACSSALYAVEQAYRAINDGLCDAALVASGSLCLHPYLSMQFCKLGVLSTDGRCKTFDESADGYARSEAACVILLQKAKDARRLYATLVHGKINCDGFKEEGISFPSRRMQSQLLREFYRECGVPPRLIGYVEAHGTGTRVGDPEEVAAIDDVFCGDRPAGSPPLLVGSVKSNLGHSEATCGLVSIAKVVIAMEAGVIPANLHYQQCKRELTAIADGRVRVVDEATAWRGGYAAVNSFGFGGANAHVLLRSNDKEKLNEGAPEDDLPRLVVASGRTEEAVSWMLTDLESRTVDVEQVALLHGIHSEEVVGHLYRGYTLLPPRGVVESRVRDVQPISIGSKRPVWFVFSGMGSQWPGMGEALLRIPIFAKAIEECSAALKPFGIDVARIITNKEKTAFDLVVNSFVGITAVQIGLLNVLSSIGIEPDNIIGHSAGELACAYADGCFTVEQTILAAYLRGQASSETKVIRGSMAAVGLGHEELKGLLPADVEVACHNSSRSATISGPAESVERFVAELTAKNIFAREVACSNVPYHSRYIAPVGAKLLTYLRRVIHDPRPRSDKWVSTSVPRDKWDTDLARYSSAEYHTNNLLSPVLFEEASALIPEDAIAIEIAPHGLLQAILKRSLAPSVANIPLTQRGHKDNVEMLLQAVGKMFNAGLHPQLSNLYPTVEFPVSRSTPMISPLIKWEHSDDWFVTSYKSQERMTSSERTVKISLSDSDYESLAGHVIDGRNLFPATGYLTLIWETLGMMRGQLHTEVSVVFEDIRFLRATTLPKDGDIELTLIIHKGSGKFEIVEGDTAVVTGLVRSTPRPSAEKSSHDPSPRREEESMTSRDVYKELRLRGYQYTGAFRGITRASASGSRGRIAWRNEWVAFMDNMLQMKIIAVDSRGLFVPTAIRRLVIDSAAHFGQMRLADADREFEVSYDKLHDVITCGGVEISGIKTSAISRRKPAGEPVIEEYKFVPCSDGADVGLRDIARLSIHLALENQTDVKVRTVELVDDADETSFADLLSTWISEALANSPSIRADLTVLTRRTDLEHETISVLSPDKASRAADALLVAGKRLLAEDRIDHLNALLDELKPGGFLLTREKHVDYIDGLARSKGFHLVLLKKHGKESFALLKKRGELRQRHVVIKVNNKSFDWVDAAREAMARTLEEGEAGITRILFVGQGDFENGLLGLVNCLRREPGGEFIRGIHIQDPRAPPFSLENALYAEQLQKDLAINVLRERGVWGTYRHLPLEATQSRPVRHAYVKQLARGDLSTLTWVEGPLNPEISQDNLARIAYASLNFRDVMLASGKLTTETVAATRLMQDSVIGLEFSGVDGSGNRIMGLIGNRALSNLCLFDRNLTWSVPESWTLEDAATVPCVYATCIYAFYMIGKMKKGDRVLIHAGTGGVGQAAINLALHEGCEVFTTVGTSEKRQFIREHFPQIPESHIGNSRDMSFERMVMKQTNGRGVDIVLNSLAEEKLLASVRCLAKRGHFLEIGKFDLAANNPLGMECFLNEIHFHGVLLDNLFNDTDETKAALRDKIAAGLTSGAIKPLTRTVFIKDQLELAFRFMAAGKHIGKVIIKVRDENEPPIVPMMALPRYSALPGYSYIILGGLGGFGLELVDWLVLRGAQNLVITSRTGIKNGYQQMRIDLWKSYGVNVIIVSGKDASKREDCQAIIDTANELGPVDGIFNLAVVLKDSIWDNQTPESFEESFRPKAWSTTQLDVLTRRICPELRHFVVFSSLSCGRGNAGQTNYGMSNSVMERICEKRKAEGLPGLAIQWGAIGDVGLVAEMQEDNTKLVIGGTLQQSISSCLQELDGFLCGSQPIVSSMVVAETAGSVHFLDIVEAVLGIMGLKDLKGISLNATLAEVGMDSMMAVEIKQSLERDFETFLNAQDIRALTFGKLQEMAAARKSGNAADESSGSDAFEEMKMLIRIVADVTQTSRDTYLKLQTKGETGRDEILMIPGIEGLAYVFANLAPKLQAPATCLQLDIGHNKFDTVAEMASFFLPYVLEKCKCRPTFTLVGYSFGALVAIELARQLEEHDLNGRLILIDGAPEQLKTIMTHGMSYTTPEDLENQTFVFIAQLIASSDTVKFAADMKKCKNWNEKLDLFLQRFSSLKANLSMDEKRDYCTSLYKRILAIVNHDPAQLKPMRCPITLVRPTSQSFKTSTEDYGLSKLTSGLIDIHFATGDHVTILDNDRVASIVNEIK